MDFCADLGTSPCPAAADTALWFLSWKKEQGSLDVSGTLAAIRNLHTVNGAAATGLSDPRLSQMRTALAKLVKVQEERDPISSVDLRRIFLGLNESKSDSRVLKAALSLGFFGLLRMAELTSSKKDKDPALTTSSLAWSRDHVVVRIWKSKTDRTRRSVTVSIPRTGSSICPYTALRSYLAVRPASSFPGLFLWPNGNPISSAALRSRFLVECGNARLEGHFNGHSLRIGGASMLAAKGVEIESIMKLGRWKSESVRRYLKNPNDRLAKIASLLDQ